MKKILAIILLVFFCSINLSIQVVNADKVTDPELIKEFEILANQVKEKSKKDHKESFEKIYFDQFIKCTKKNFFSKNDIIFFGLPLKILHKEIHGGWDAYKYDFTNWHIMQEFNKKYYIFHKTPGVINSTKPQIIYKIDRETGDMYEYDKSIKSEKKVRNCEKISYSDLPKLETNTKF